MSRIRLIVNRSSGKGVFSSDHVSGGGHTDRPPIHQLDSEIGAGQRTHFDVVA
jgi:hypothetical protein